jgi:hypothetical protein
MKLRLFAILALLILPLPALAGPREDVVSGSARCASFADDRQFLDCYYGAAQPMRAALGLPAASAAQVSLANGGLGGRAAIAGPRSDVLTGAGRCTSFADNRQFLDCYYGAAQPMRARLGLPPAAAAQVSLASAARGAMATASAGIGAGAAFGQRRKSSGGWFSGIFGSDEDEAVPASEYGLRNRGRGEPVDNGPVETLTALMASYKIDSLTHHFVIDLDNGQRWAQLSGDTTEANWTRPPARYEVQISRGWFGSYNMRVNGPNERASYKVTRLK